MTLEVVAEEVLAVAAVRVAEDATVFLAVLLTPFTLAVTAVVEVAVLVAAVLEARVDLAAVEVEVEDLVEESMRLAVFFVSFSLALAAVAGLAAPGLAAMGRRASRGALAGPFVIMWQFPPQYALLLGMDYLNTGNFELVPSFCLL